MKGPPLPSRHWMYQPDCISVTRLSTYLGAQCARPCTTYWLHGKDQDTSLFMLGLRSNGGYKKGTQTHVTMGSRVWGIKVEYLPPGSGEWEAGRTAWRSSHLKPKPKKIGEFSRGTNRGALEELYPSLYFHHAPYSAISYLILKTNILICQIPNAVLST